MRALLAYAALVLATAIGVVRWAALDDDGRRLDDQQRAAIFADLRAIVDGRRTAKSIDLPGLATLYCHGRVVARAPLATAAALHSDVVSALSDEDRALCRLKLDVIRGRGPILAVDPVLALSLIPGVDGIGVSLPDREVLLTADDLLLADASAGHRLVPDVDLAIGLDGRAALRLLATGAGLSPDAWRRTPHRLFRFRAESSVEPAVRGSPPLPTLRGRALSPPPPLDAAHLTDAAVRGGRYLVRHLRPGGRFDYVYDTLHDQPLGDDDYSLTRHAGTVGFLAQLHHATGDAEFRDAAQRALAHLVTNRPDGCDRPELACVGEPADTFVDLGAAALALAAAVELERSAASTPALVAWSRRLAAFLVDKMQRPDGSFAHLYRPATNAPDDTPRLPFFSGEAAFALAGLATIEPRHQEPTRRALDALLAEADATLLGHFVFGEEHWTCMAVDAAWEFLDEPRRARLGDFCEGFARFLRRAQFTAGEGPLVDQPDFEGSYGFTPLLAPHTTPVGSRVEALLSCRRIALRRGHPRVAEEISSQLAPAQRFLLGHQITADSAWLMPDPAAAEGGFLMSDVERFVRIDFVQHAGSALLRSGAPPLSR